MSLAPHPCQCTAIVGHDAAKKQLEEAYDSGRMHHAWLLTGAEGIGKTSLAYHAAHMLLSGGTNRFAKFNPNDSAARLITAQSHPDLFVLDRPPDEKTGVLRDLIPVEEARKLAPFLHMTASYGHGRVAIIDEVHTLNRNGQNAILKVIEEPPSGAILFLTATTLGALVPTIRSRCRVLALEPLSPAQLDVILMRLNVDLPLGPDKARLLDLAGGSVSAALGLLQTEALPLFAELLDILERLPALDRVRIHKLADKIGKKADSESFLAVTGLLTEQLRRTVRAAALGTTDETGLAAKLAPNGRLDKALELWEKTRQTFASADGAKLDRKLVFINALCAFGKL